MTTDQTYLHHHVRCPQCTAAGLSPGRKQRCSTGQAAWDIYNQAGMPPFLQPRAAATGPTP